MRRALPLAAVAALCACGVPTLQTYEVDGVVQGVSADRVRIAHAEIPGFMPAMTMNFDVASPELLEGIEPGMRVRFQLEREATLLRVTGIDPTGERVPLREPPRSEPAGAARGALEPAPGFELVDQGGRPLALDDLRGSAILLDFMFTRCPGPCPALTSAHVAVQRSLPPALAARTHFVSISIDPAHDTPERLRAYAEARGADLARWSFLTGDPARVDAVLRAYRVGTVAQPDGSIDHVLVTFLIDPAGRIERRYVGTDHGADELIEGIREVLG